MEVLANHLLTVFFFMHKPVSVLVDATAFEVVQHPFEAFFQYIQFIFAEAFENFFVGFKQSLLHLLRCGDAFFCQMDALGAGILRTDCPRDKPLRFQPFDYSSHGRIGKVKLLFDVFLDHFLIAMALQIKKDMDLGRGQIDFVHHPVHLFLELVMEHRDIGSHHLARNQNVSSFPDFYT